MWHLKGYMLFCLFLSQMAVASVQLTLMIKIHFFIPLHLSYVTRVSCYTHSFFPPELALLSHVEVEARLVFYKMWELNAGMQLFVVQSAKVLAWICRLQWTFFLLGSVRSKNKLYIKEQEIIDHLLSGLLFLYHQI
jgi:hypothetical protein